MMNKKILQEICINLSMDYKKGMVCLPNDFIHRLNQSHKKILYKKKIIAITYITDNDNQIHIELSPDGDFIVMEFSDKALKSFLPTNDTHRCNLYRITNSNTNVKYVKSLSKMFFGL